MFEKSNNNTKYLIISKEKCRYGKRRGVEEKVKKLAQKADQINKGSTEKDILDYIKANIAKPPTQMGIRKALKDGVSTKFFSKRDNRYKIITKNI